MAWGEVQRESAQLLANTELCFDLRRWCVLQNGWKNFRRSAQVASVFRGLIRGVHGDWGRWLPVWHTEQVFPRSADKLALDGAFPTPKTHKFPLFCH